MEERDSEPAVEVRTVTLRKPVAFEGRTIEKVEMNFDLLTGRALRAAERHFIAQGGVVPPGGATSSQSYAACCAAQISGLPIEAIEALSGTDYTEVTMLVQGFLFGVDLPEEVSPSTSSESGF